MNASIAFLVKRGLLVNLITLFLFILGVVVSVKFLQIEAFPNVNLDIIQIDAFYPGASPNEVEQLVITPIEQELKSLNGIDKMTSMSFPGSGRIKLEVDPHSNNREKLSNEISLAIDRATLPTDLPNDPFVTEVDGSVFPVIRIIIAAPIDDLALKRLGDKVKDDLLEIVGVAQIVVQGDRKAEYRITVDPEKMLRERIAVADVANIIKAWNINAPGGEIDTVDGQQSVRIVGEFSSIEEAENLVLRANASGHVLLLKDIATVIEALEEPRTLHDVEAQPALSMLVLKNSKADIIQVVDGVYDYVDTINERYGDDITVKTFQDFSRFARIRLGVLTNNGLVGVGLVFVTLLLFLRFSVAITTTWGLPIIFMTGVFVIYSFGMTLNLISMMGFIMVLGMLVDDAIIIGENITHHMEKGQSPIQAAITGSVELIGPVTTTILTTIAAFLPMVFMSGIIGKFVLAIPIVVITLLILSWLESFLVLPSHVAHVTNPNKHPKEKKWLKWLEDKYANVLTVAMRFRWVTVGFSFLILIGAIVLAKTSMQFQLFPPVGVEEFVVRVTAPPGTSLQNMRQNLRDVDKTMREVISTEHVVTSLAKSGDVSVDEGDPLTQRGSRYGQINVVYSRAIFRSEHNVLDDMKLASKKLTDTYPLFDISVTELKPGPPVGRALEAEISSYDDTAGIKAAQGLMQYLETVDGVSNIDSGLKAGDTEVYVTLDRERATYAGVDLLTVSSHVRAAASGLIVSSLRRGTEELDVTIRFPKTGVNEKVLDDMEQLKNLLIPNKRGGYVALHKIAKFEKNPGFTTIRHKSGIKVVSVVANIDTDIITSGELNDLVRNNESLWKNDADNRVVVNYGGEEEKNQESFESLLVAFGFALVAIFFILAIQFNNLSYPLVVMLAIPFGAIGVIFSFYLHDIFWKPMPLSFFSSMGMVALTGVVVNSSLILLVFVQRARQNGVEMMEAIIQAGRRRLRAVLLTATTTVVGLLPTAYGWGGLDNFVSPMALALSWGLIFATVVTLFTIPAALAVGHDTKYFFIRLFSFIIRRFRKETVTNE